MPDSGKRFVVAAFRIRSLSGSLQESDVGNTVAVIGSNGQTYLPDVANIANGAIHVPQGKTMAVSVTFQVPEEIRVTKVQWTLGGSGCTVQWEVRRTWPASCATAIGLVQEKLFRISKHDLWSLRAGKLVVGQQASAASPSAT